MTAPFTKRIAADPAALPPLADAIDVYLAQAGVSPGAIAKLMLALDEILANVATHAYPGDDGWIVVTAEVADGSAILSVRDAGHPFDPTARAAPDTAAGVEERPIGGLGIFLVRELMDRFDYARDGGTNLTTIALATG